jgi:hypothetical protein
MERQRRHNFILHISWLLLLNYSFYGVVKNLIKQQEVRSIN